MCLFCTVGLWGIKDKKVDGIFEVPFGWLLDAKAAREELKSLRMGWRALLFVGVVTGSVVLLP